MAFDLDNEELKATRKLHNQDDGLYEETSDKDVENIKIVIKDCREHLKLYGEAFITANELDRIEHILSKRKQDKKRIQELEEEKAMLKKASNIAKEVNIEDVTNVINKSCKEFMSNYIPKQVIIDKIKEYDKKMEEDTGHPNWVITDRIVINVLQELLGGDEKK